MTATEVKAKILALLDEVADGDEIEITTGESWNAS